MQSMWGPVLIDACDLSNKLVSLQNVGSLANVDF